MKKIKIVYSLAKLKIDRREEKKAKQRKFFS